MRFAALAARAALPLLLASTPASPEGARQDELGAPSLAFNTTAADGGGVVVTSVYRDGPAARAGLVRGDVILAVNGTTVFDHDGFLSILASLPVDKPAVFKVSRKGQVKTVTATAERAVPLYTRLCEAGDLGACGTIGSMLQTGSRVPRDVPKAEPILRKACDGGYLPSCVNLGNIFERGQLGTPDPAKAVKPYETACKGGLLEGCINLARLYDMGKGVPQDQPRARELYRQACDAGDSQCCVVVARAYYFGFGIPVDKAKAKEYFLKACQLGDPRACQMVKSSP